MSRRDVPAMASPAESRSPHLRTKMPLPTTSPPPMRRSLGIFPYRGANVEWQRASHTLSKPLPLPIFDVRLAAYLDDAQPSVSFESGHLHVFDIFDPFL